MKITFIVGTLGRGGAEKQLLYMLRALKNSEIKAEVLCLTKNEPYEDEIKSLGINVEWVGAGKNRGWRLLTIVKRLKKNPPDIVQSSHFYANIYAGFAGKILGLPSIGAVRSDFTSEVKLHGALGRWQVSLPDVLIVNSRLAYEKALEKGVKSQRLEFVRNAVETDASEQKSRANGKSPLKMLFVGRLDKNKRPEKFIALAAGLTKKLPEVSLKYQIAGDGELKQKLKIMAQNLNLTADKVEFLGMRSDMSAVYRQADVLISTSVREGTSNAILEAMAHGLPVIASNAGGTPDIVSESRGFLVKPDDEKDLFAVASKLVSDRDLRVKLGSNAREYVYRNHSISSLEKQLSDVYKKLI